MSAAFSSIWGYRQKKLRKTLSPRLSHTHRTWSRTCKYCKVLMIMARKLNKWAIRAIISLNFWAINLVYWKLICWGGKRESFFDGREFNLWIIYSFLLQFHHKFIEQALGTCNISIRLQAFPLARNLFATC